MKPKTLTFALTGATVFLMLLTYTAEWRPNATRIAIAQATVAQNDDLRKKYEEATRNRAYYDKLKAETIAALNRTSDRASMPQLEATFLREVEGISHKYNVPWRAIKPSAPTAVASPVATGSPVPVLIPASVDTKSVADSFAGIVEVQPITLEFRGENAAVLKALSALGDGKVLIAMEHAGLAIDAEGSPDADRGGDIRVQGLTNILIFRVTADEKRLFATPVVAPATTIRPGGVNART